MASTRRRFEMEESVEAGESLQQLESQVVFGDELLEEAPESEEESQVSVSAEEPLAPAAPVAFLLALPGATLRKQDGTTEAVEAGTVLTASGWLPLGEGLVAANLGGRGKWTVLVTEWVVYYKG